MRVAAYAATDRGEGERGGAPSGTARGRGFEGEGSVGGDSIRTIGRWDPGGTGSRNARERNARVSSAPTAPSARAARIEARHNYRYQNFS
jgi:hypothetical protein